MGRQLYLFIGNRREGPYEMAEVREMLEAEELDFDGFCQPVGSARRRRLSEIFEVVPGEEDDEDWKEDDDPEAADGEEEAGEEEPEEIAEDAETLPPGHLLYAGHPAILSYPVSLFVALVGGVGGYLLGPQSLWYFILGWAFAIGAMLFILVDRTTRQYLVTPRRVEVIWGLIVKSSNEVLIRDIRIINVRRSGFRGFFGVGTVDFSSVGDAVDVAFENISRPQRVKSLVRALQDEAAD